MSFAAEHYFWQQRVDREIGARNKFIENNFLKNKSENGLSFGPDGKITMNGSFNLYEVGLSDPNQLRPREFKYHKTNVPLDFSNTTYEQLAKLTSSGSTYDGLMKKKSPINEYTGYQQKSNNGGSRALSQISSKRKSFALIAQQNLQQNQLQLQNQQTRNNTIDHSNNNNQNNNNNNEQRTYDGKRKRQRFNEDYDDTVSRNSLQHARTAVSQSKLTQGSLNKLNTNGNPNGPRNDSQLSSQLLSQSKKSQLKSLATIQKAYYKKQQDAKTDNSSQFRAKVSGMISQLDEKQLEKLTQELEANNIINKNDNEGGDQDGNIDKVNGNGGGAADYQDELRDVVVGLDTTANKQQQQNDDAVSVSDIKSVTTDMRSNRSMSKSQISNFSAINKLSQQLDEERKQRENMQREIEELKKMNNDLCNAIISTKDNSPNKNK